MGFYTPPLYFDLLRGLLRRAPFMITAPKERDAHLPSTWIAAVCIIVLAVGLQGAVTPIMPPQTHVVVIDTGENVAMEEFDPPAAGPAELTPELPEEPEMEIEEEIPPLPVLEAPLTPPEMTELTPLEEVKIQPPQVKPVPPKPTPPKPRPAARRPAAAPSVSNGTGSGAGGGTGPPSLFTRGGSGRFPSPGYPASARAAKQQGTVRLLVVVESSGMPGSVSVQSSSGVSALDNAAAEHVRRRWRWPSGETRRYIVPVRFVLK